jgi:dihydrofolate reductase
MSEAGSGVPIWLVVAMAENGIIGRDGDLPWRLSSDLKHFKSVTMGKPVIMGRKTWASIGRPLPGRTNIVVTRQADFAADGATIVHTVEEGLALAQVVAHQTGAEAVCVIGGGELYRATMDRADLLSVTNVLAEIDGDTQFPVIDPSNWKATDSVDVAAGERDSHATRRVRYVRRAAD